MDKLIITAAICGAEVTKEQNPAVPYTVEEIVREAKSAVDGNWKSLRPNVLVSHESGDRAVIIQRTQSVCALFPCLSFSLVFDGTIHIYECLCAFFPC